MRALASLGGKSLPPSNSDFSDRLLTTKKSYRWIGNIEHSALNIEI